MIFTPHIYIFELQERGITSGYEPKDALNLLSDIYNCDYTHSNNSIGYLKHASRAENQFLMRHNSRIWKSCQNLLPSEVACFLPEFHAATCPMFPIRLIKTVRLRVPSIEELLQDRDLNLKVIVLVRDPRGLLPLRIS